MSIVQANIQFYIGNYETKIVDCDIFVNGIQNEGCWIDNNVYVHRIPNQDGLWKVLYFMEDNIVKISEYYSLNTPSIELLKSGINHLNEVKSIWKGNLQYTTSEYNSLLDNVKMDTVKLVNPSELYRVNPTSWSVKSLIPTDPNSLEEFKQCAEFSLANAEWLTAEEKRLDAVLRIRRKNYEIEFDTNPITGNYTTHIKGLITKAVEGDIELDDLQHKLNKIQLNRDETNKKRHFDQNYSGYFDLDKFVTIDNHSMTFFKCWFYFIKFFIYAGVNNLNNIFTKNNK